jgi:hypothetical protein
LAAGGNFIQRGQQRGGFGRSLVDAVVCQGQTALRDLSFEGLGKLADILVVLARDVRPEFSRAA